MPTAKKSNNLKWNSTKKIIIRKLQTLIQNQVEFNNTQLNDTPKNKPNKLNHKAWESYLKTQTEYFNGKPLT